VLVVPEVELPEVEVSAVGGEVDAGLRVVGSDRVRLELAGRTGGSGA
jgi:hypothetical protein